MTSHGHDTNLPPVNLAPSGDLVKSFNQLAPSPGTLVDLGNEMHDARGVKPFNTILAGYTYLGQFIDHDITFLSTTESNPTGFFSKRLPYNQVTPILDLSSVYGKGFYDPKVGVLKDTGELSLSSVEDEFGNVLQERKDDLPRNEDKVALIPDHRNDENLLIAQLHVLFIKFHNKLISLLPESFSPKQKFEIARLYTIETFQKIVVKDFLHTLLDDKIYTLYFANKSPRDFPNYWLSRSAKLQIPLEFSGAAFRFGHAMVQPEYEIQDNKPHVTLKRLFALTGKFGLAGFNKLPEKFTVNWLKFFDINYRGEIDPKGQIAGPVFANNIRPHVKITIPGKEWPANKLSIRNLLRARELALPSAQELYKELTRSLARHSIDPKLYLKKIEHYDMQDREFDYYKNIPNWQFIEEQSTPLWYYFLREVEHFGDLQTLGPVASLVIAETFSRILTIQNEDAWLKRHGTTSFNAKSWLKAKDSLVLRNQSNLEVTSMIDLINFVVQKQGE